MEDALAKFQQDGEQAAAPVAKAENAESKAISVAKEEIKELIASDPTYNAVRNSRVNDIKVVKILGFGKGGTIVDRTQDTLRKKVADGTLKVLEAATEGQPEVAGEAVINDKGEIVGGTVVKSASGKLLPPYMVDEKGVRMTRKNPNKDGAPVDRKVRVIVQEPENVGYTIQNVSATPITFETKVFSQDETGKYVGTEVTNTLEPGATTNISRLYLNKLAIRPEFNLKFANGAIACRGLFSGSDDAEELLKKPYFLFNAASGQDINSPEVKTIISTVDASGKTVVKPEYTEVFGELNNEKEKAPRQKREAAPKDSIDSYEIAAQRMRQFIK